MTLCLNQINQIKNSNMKIFKKVLKGFAKVTGIFSAVIILAGLVFRLFGPEAHKPMGKLVDIGDFKLHINSTGVKDDQPTLVIEGGCGMATEYYHWLSEGLKDSIRVVRYDRAGIGYSEASNTPRTPDTIARELHQLLKNAGESPPYIMAGHSLGGPYIRVFTELYPDEVVGMLLLDATHPNYPKRKKLPRESSWTWKFVIGFDKAKAVLADMGILMLYDKLVGPSFGREMEGLPEEINSRTADYLINGKYAQALAMEFENYYSTLQRAGTYTDFDSLPIRIFTKKKSPSKAKSLWGELQEDYLHLSTDSKLIEIDGGHNTIYTIKENADIICEEVLQLLGDLGY